MIKKQKDSSGSRANQKASREMTQPQRANWLVAGKRIKEAIQENERIRRLH